MLGFSILLFLFIATLLIFLKVYWYGYWKRRGVPGPAPTMFLGNTGESLFMKKSALQIYGDIYEKYQNAPIVGIFKATTPTLIIRDTELIKDIVVKSFSNFHDNDIDVDQKDDPLFGRNTFVLKGEHWKTIRALLTPCFTSGKMKSLFPILNEISQQFVDFTNKQPNAFNGVGYEAKELCTKFTLNNVASCAFGLDGKCFEDENSRFRQIARRFLTPSSWTSAIFLLALAFPAIAKFFKLKFVTKDVEDELFNIVSETLKYRKENNVVRNDFLHFMMQLKETSKDYKFTDVDITAQAAGFFGDGYETSSITMSFLAYNIAANPEAQRKLREEIDEKLETNDGKLTYDMIQEMPYLEAMFNESLRITPPLFALFKRCTKRYTYVPKNNDVIKNNVVIEEGVPVVLPIFGLHHDPKYWEDPNSFIPERFLAPNKENNNKYAFLPFGEGPRVCLGQRFGVLQIKVGIIHLVRNFELSVNGKTKQPFKYNPLYFMASPIGGIWLDFKKIQNINK